MYTNPQHKPVRPGDQISAGAINKLCDFVRSFDNFAPAVPHDMTGSPFPVVRPPAVSEWADVFPAKIRDTTTQSSGKYAFTEQIWDSTASPPNWKDLPNGRTDASEGTGAVPMDANGSLSSGTVVLLCRTVNGDTLLYVALASPASATLPVTLTKDGGSDGNGSSDVSYTYTVKDLDGNAVKDSSGNPLTGIAPAHNRMLCKTMPATYGTLAKKSDGSYVLYQTDELPNFGTCQS